MSRPFTLGALVLRVRRVTDSENGAPSDTEIKEFISSYLGELHEEYDATNLRFYEKEQTITTDGNQSYAVASDYLNTLGVDYKASATEYRALKLLQTTERNRYNGSTGGNAQQYAVIGDETGAQKVRLFPTPPSGQAYRHVYVPQPPDLSAAADATVVDVITAAGEQFLVWGAAIMVFAKEGDDAGVALAERMFERAKARIQAYAHNKNMLQSGRIIDVDEERPYRTGDWSEDFD